MFVLRRAMQHRTTVHLVTTLRMLPWAEPKQDLTAAGFEPVPLRTGALSQRLRPLGQIGMFQTKRIWL